MPITQILLTATVSSSPPATAVMSLIANDYFGSGTSWGDSSGNSNPGTLVNDPAYTNTVPKHFSFDRTSNQFVQGPDLGDLSTWTIESWFRLSESLTTTTATAVITTTFSIDGGNLYGNINYVLGNWNESEEDGGSEALTVGFYDGSWHTTTGFTPELDTWYHVVGTYDGTTIKQWVNGVLDSDRVFTGTPIANGGPVRIGRRWDGASDDDQTFFPGDIAVVKIYNGVLTDEEIVAAYDSTSATYST